VTIASLQFVPAVVTVTAGTTVIWTNSDPGIPHTSTSDSGVWDSGTINGGASYAQTFTTVGTFPYHCTIHPFMHGTIVVVPAGTGATSTPVTPGATNSPAPSAPAGTSTKLPAMALAATSVLAAPATPLATQTPIATSVVSAAPVAATAPPALTPLPGIVVVSATFSSAGGTLSGRVVQTFSAGNSGAQTLRLIVPAGAVSQSVTLAAAAAPAAVVPTATTSAPLGAAIVLSAGTADGRLIHSFTRPLTLTVSYDPRGLSLAAQSTLFLAFFDTTSQSWISLPTTVDSSAHTLTATVTHVTLFQARLLAGAAVRLAWPRTVAGGPAQGTLVGGRTAACPAVPALLRLIAHRRLEQRFARPYPAGCLWVPVQVSDAALAPQFAGAAVAVTATFADATRVVLDTRLDGRAHAIAVLAVPFLPRAGDRAPGHRGPAAVATIKVTVTDRHGTRQPPLQARFVVVAPLR
jgi:hypothetical protein